jgi:hypothetical protein
MASVQSAINMAPASLPDTKRAPTPKVLYVFGAGHSGSTLLDVLLNRHPDIAGTGELHRLCLSPESRLCGCGELLTQCTWWQPVIARYAQMHAKDGEARQRLWADAPVSLPRDGYATDLPFRFLEVAAVTGSAKLAELAFKYNATAAQYRRVIANSLDLCRAIADVHRVSVIVDSTKDPLRGKLLYMAAPLQVYCLYLVRDGRAVAASQMRREQVSMKTAAKAWVGVNRKVMHALRSVTKYQKMTLRYEDLCSDPVKSVNQIYRWLDLREVATADLAQSAHEPAHEIPGNPMLFNGVRQIRMDDRWRNELDAGQLRVFRKIAGSMNARFGNI